MRITFPSSDIMLLLSCLFAFGCGHEPDKPTTEGAENTETVTRTSTNTPPLTPASDASQEVTTVKDIVVDVSGTTTSPGSEDLIFDSESEIARFSFHGESRVIYKSKTFAATSPTPQQFVQHTFFIFPNVDIYLADIEASYNAKKEVGEVQKTALYEMKFQLILIDEEIKSEAAKAINSRFEGAKVTAGNIAIAPFKMLELYAKVANRYILLQTIPSIRVSDSTIQLANRPEIVPVSLVAPNDVLDAFKHSPKMRAEFALTGFTVRQNILSLALNRFTMLGYHHFLTGDAKWEDLREYGTSSKNLGVSLGPLTLGGSSDGGFVRANRSGWVSRNQVKDVVQASAELLTDTMWVEIKGKQNLLNKFQETMVNDLLRRAKAKEVEYDAEKKSLVNIDENIQKDLTPDQIANVNNEVKSKWDTKQDTKVTVKGVPVEVKNEMTDDEGITWKLEGTAIVPKRVSLYLFSNATFESLMTRRFIYTEADKSHLLYVQDGRCGRRIDVPAETVTEHVDLRLQKIPIAHVPPGDFDVDTGGHDTTVQFRTATTLDANRVRIECFYRVKEEVDDFTEYRETVPFEYLKPQEVRDSKGANRSVIRIDGFAGGPPPGQVDYNLRTQEQLRDLDIDVGGTIVNRMRLQVDRDDDDNSIVGFDGTASFDVVLRLAEASYLIVWE